MNARAPAGMPATHERFAAAQAQGARPYQEDFYAMLDCGGAAAGEHSLLLLADGMGGHSRGDIASSLAIKVAGETYRSTPGTVAERLARAVDGANDALAETIERDPLMAGIGCTLAIVAATAAGIEWVSVGDSPLWCYRNYSLERLNADHSMLPVLVAMAADGLLSEEDAHSDPKRHVLRSAVRGEPLRLIDRSAAPRAAHPGDLLILASDGLLSIDDASITRILARVSDAGADLNSAAQALLAAVAAAGEPNQDNATVLLYAPLPTPAMGGL